MSASSQAHSRASRPAAGPSSPSLPGAWLPDYENEPASSQSQRPPRETRPEPAPKRRAHYPPRQCRICLEDVLPTFETPDEGLPGMLKPAPRVTYVSEDPELGRLLKPCKCKGSQKYVHEGCLQAWRYSDVGSRRNYFQCPTCGWRYRLERMRWSRWIGSTATQVALTVSILLLAVFVLGFVADPIINLYLDPYETITAAPLGTMPLEEDTWAEHFLKGMASLGLLGAIKALFAMGPWNWWNLRNAGLLGGGNRGRGNAGRGRLESISWTLVAVGIVTFLWVCGFS